MKTYYEILGLLQHADDVVIKAAYKALAQKYHPDKHKFPSDESHRLMTELNAAFDVLGDAGKRKRYDVYLTRAAQPLQPNPQPHPQPAPKTVNQKNQELVDKLIQNSLDEIAVLQLFEKFFGCSVQINNSWINTYTVKLDGMRQNMDYLALKKRLIERLNQEAE
ncbi:MAG: hypothetical protein RLY90_1005 [Pseudomonadota bacterium]